MRIALAQIAPEVGDFAGNVRRILEAVRRAEREGADLVALPELAVTGYPPEDLLKRPAFMRAAERATGEVIAAVGGVTAVFGAPRMEGGRCFNSAFLARDGRMIGVYDKQRLPNYGVFDERRYFHPGDGRNCVFRIGGRRVGIGICEDLWHDDLAARQAELGCDLWLNLNASPFHAGKQAEREALVARRARQFGAPVAYLNPVGGQDEIVFDGGSHAADAEGRLLLRAPMFEPWFGALSLDDAQAAVPEIAPMPGEVEQVHRALVLGVRDYVRRNGCADVVIGLSGGIDSAVTAAIAVDALGRGHVLGALLPSRFSSEHSVTDALALAENLGIETITLPIQAGVDAIEGVLAPVFADWGLDAPDVTEENIQARVRGVLLMAVSNKTGRMLLTTGNKSEMAVGYATLYGDMAGGFAVLKDVWKTQVYALADWINREREIIPENTIRKPPSAELRPGQKDSDSLPDYAVLDAILAACIEERLGVDEIAARGYDRAEVARVVRMVHLAEYKRRQAPPGVKITRRAFGRDRRYPITHAFREWEES